MAAATVIEANRGDSPWWCGLDAGRFEADFLNVPARVADQQLQRWVERYDAAHRYPLEGEVGGLDACCPLQAGFRSLTGKRAAMVVYLVCVNECGVSVHCGRHQKSPARTFVDLCSDHALRRCGFSTALQGAGFDYDWFREAWRLLCKTAGFDLASGGASPLPGWLRDAAGSICGYAGLLDPGEVRALAGSGRSPDGRTFRDALAVVAPRLDCRQDAEDLALLVDVASILAGGGRWLLSVQAAT
jgi:hypothetical protein